MYGYGVMNEKKKKPRYVKTVSAKEMNKSRHGKLDKSLDDLFGSKTKSVGWTNRVGEWRHL